ncbi:MAG TPA: amino acid adenylation domain-containing protein [Candidatus Melainabacteria bacterium]|nr:amino acid adenylation domain-containing protein [Candidatus Melainabacteria bacterium]HIN63097.1 amino acid adenylation domain-containing protein [Candidatus Obscuribacterales bacterium]
MYIYNLGGKFKSVAAGNPDACALICENGKTTYQQLDSYSDSFADYLISAGVNPGELICIAGDKSPQTIACIIGTLKAGVTYSVFDSESPIARLEKIFQRCNPSLIICDSSLRAGIEETGYKTVDRESIDFDRPVQNKLQLHRLLQSTASNSPAYVMFTSGSTGFPKGATMTHQNVLNLIEWSVDTYSFISTDVLTSVNPLYFDNSVFDLYSSLFSGASLALFDGATVRDPRKLMHLIDEFGCTSWFSVPSMLIYLQTMRALRPESFRHIRRIIFGGEGYPKAKLKELFDIFSDRVSFYNVYGPTECTCICSSYSVQKGDFVDLKGFLPLGELAKNFGGLIVDEELRTVNPGESGELILRGPNVGLGYYRDPERTAAAFIQNPEHDSFPDIVYRTGDLVYLNQEDGKIWITGRADNQIKHMGYRIELEEIENALNCIEAVAQNAVIHCEIRGLSQLVAFVKAKDAECEEDLLRRRLSELIPQYMIPTKFQFLNQLPKNANGKLDRKQLKAGYLGQLVNE